MEDPHWFVLPGYPSVNTADFEDRAYIAAACNPSLQVTCVVRLNASGTADYTARVQGAASSIAVDGLGAAFTAGYTQGTSGTRSFLAQLSPDGSPGFYSTTLAASSTDDSATVAVATNGQPVVLFTRAVDYSAVLQRFDSTGTVTLSKPIPPGVPTNHPIFAVDTAGNAYVPGSSGQLYPVKNSLATCGTDWLSVYAPDGSILQTTYIPAGESALKNDRQEPEVMMRPYGAAGDEPCGSLAISTSGQEASATIRLRTE